MKQGFTKRFSRAGTTIEEEEDAVNWTRGAIVLTMAHRTVRRVVLLVAAGVALVGCSATRTNTVTVYVSEDQVFSEPIPEGLRTRDGRQGQRRIRYRGSQDL